MSNVAQQTSYEMTEFDKGFNEGELNIIRQLAAGLITQEDALKIIGIKQ